MKRAKLLAVVAAIGLAATACSSTQHKSSGSGSSPAASDNGPHKQGGTVTIANEQGQTWTCQFNPFNPAVYAESIGFVYEPLIFVDELNNQAETPMLATSYQWNATKTEIVFTIRDGVKWSDGQPFTADDVAYTFNVMKQVPATDLYALWSAAGLQSVTASGNKVTMDFKQSAQPYFYFFADQVAIVPKHVFSSGDAAAHPDTWSDPDPVGTGPFKVSPCSANNIQYVANPTYWQAGKPYVQKIEYPAYLDNGPANLDLASGKAQWGSQYIPGIKQFYLDKSADNHTWSPPVLNVSIFPNLDPSHKATSTLAVRQAIAAAIDRTQIAAIGEGGEEPPANQSGVVLPTFQKYYDSSPVSAAGYDRPDAAKAATLLSSAGYSPSHPLNLTVITITGYTDWDASLAVIKQELAPIGINLTVSDLAQQTFDTKLYTGDYDLAYYGEPTGGPSPYYELREMLDSANSAPLGQSANGNYERYNNPAVDTLFNQYATADDAGQVSIIKQVEAAMVKDVPLIPVTESVDWFQYNTSDLGGWPTADNPYAQPAAYNFPDMEQLLLHLYSKSAK
jgi:peptide/nickel transport system substrate-binding protein